MKDIKGCLSHNTDEWRTPSVLYRAFMSEGFKDPCPFGADFDGLKLQYHNDKLFVNLPFSKLKEWVEWCIKQYLNNNCEIYLLMPSRTDTRYFHRVYEMLPVYYFLQGRLHFNDSKECAPFPTVILHLSHDDSFKGRVVSCNLDYFVNAVLFNDYGY